MRAETMLLQLAADVRGQRAAATATRSGYDATCTRYNERHECPSDGAPRSDAEARCMWRPGASLSRPPAAPSRQRCRRPRFARAASRHCCTAMDAVQPPYMECTAGETNGRVSARAAAALRPDRLMGHGNTDKASALARCTCVGVRLARALQLAARNMRRTTFDMQHATDDPRSKSAQLVARRGDAPRPSPDGAA